ncbi:MAG: lipid-transfer protein [Frankiaceae bacterium]|nr:lipid-transfer protein [Frankiaceae bacterium]MBV9870042.1 lipid-transfer protein [Frankiaceae bacterium]
MKSFLRDVAIVASATFETPSEPSRNEVEMLLPVIHDALGQVGLSQGEIGFTVSGSSDYLQGYTFAFVGALDAVGAWPPIRESHLEMDGAFALAEAVAYLQEGHVDTALVYAFARPSRGDLDRTLSVQLDPYTVAPLWPDARGLAGLQAQAMRDSGRYGDVPDVTPTYVGDGVTAVILATGDRARELTKTPVWIRGIDHRIEAQMLGLRDLGSSASTKLAGEGAGATNIDEAYLHVLYPHQELLVKDALGLDRQPVNTAAGPMMVGGLERLATAAKSIAGTGKRAVATATSGACMQQNLVAVLEGAAA